MAMAFDRSTRARFDQLLSTADAYAHETAGSAEEHSYVPKLA